MASSADRAATGIQSMPQDILENIFLLTLPAWNETMGPDKYTGTINPSQPPWIISSVCSLWRSIALEQRTLWSCIRINLFGLSVELQGKAFRITQLYLERSYPAPITIYFRDNIGDGKGGETPSYLRLLLPHSSRWAKLSLLLSYRHFKLLHEAHGQLPMLDTLQITPYAPALLNNVTTFADAPSLKRVILLDIPDPAVFILPSNQLTFLSVQIKHSMSEINFLDNTTSLGELWFSNTWPAGHASGHAATKHHSLKRLVTDSLDSLLDVEMPNLETLVIDHPTNASKTTTTPLSITMFALRSQCQLTTLSLAAVKYRDRSSIVDLFRNLPHLTHLQIIERDPFNVPWDEMVYVLTWGEGNRLLPHLAYLDLQTRARVDSGDLWISMVRSRLRNHAVFATRFICFGWYGSSLEEKSQVKEREIEGFEISRDVVEVPVTTSPQSPYYQKECRRSGMQSLLRLQFLKKQPDSGSPRISTNTFVPPFLDW